MRKPTTLRSKLLLTMLGFVLLTELVVAAAILHTTYQQTVSEARASIAVGERVLGQFMALRAEQLLSAVSILASDFGFKSAVGAHDGPALHSVLASFGSRVDADVALLADPTGQLTANVPEEGLANGSLPFSNLLAQARQTGHAAGLVMAGDRAYQFVLVPVNAPRLIAWVGMGFQIDQTLARNLASLTGLDVEFIVSEGDIERFRTGTLTLASRQPDVPLSPTADGSVFLTHVYQLSPNKPRIRAELANMG